MGIPDEVIRVMSGDSPRGFKTTFDAELKTLMKFNLNVQQLTMIHFRLLVCMHP